ncbi:MAG: hypothetical protein PVS2B2_26380 [Candidatus Acidiferrum sp.]
MTVKMMRVKRIFIAGVAVVLLGTAGLPLAGQEPAQAPPAPAKPVRAESANRLTIEVSGGEENKPVENASVYVKYVESRLLKDKKVELNVKTNREGVAHVPDAPLGRALIQVVAEGWKTYGRWYEVTDLKQNIKVHLERPPKWY